MGYFTSSVGPLHVKEVKCKEFPVTSMYVTKEFTTISTDTSINWGFSVSRISPCVVEHAHCSIFLLSKTVERCHMEERGQTTCSHSCKMTAMLSHVKLWCSFFLTFEVLEIHGRWAPWNKYQFEVAWVWEFLDLLKEQMQGPWSAVAGNTLPSENHLPMGIAGEGVLGVQTRPPFLYFSQPSASCGTVGLPNSCYEF